MSLDILVCTQRYTVSSTILFLINISTTRENCSSAENTLNKYACKESFWLKTVQMAFHFLCKFPLKPTSSLEHLSIFVSYSPSLVSQSAQKARHQYLIRVQGTLQLPSSTSWSGQLHRRAGKETAGWKRLEQKLLTGSCSVQRASKKQSAVQSRASGATRRAQQ